LPSTYSESLSIASAIDPTIACFQENLLPSTQFESLPAVQLYPALQDPTNPRIQVSTSDSGVKVRHDGYSLDGKTEDRATSFTINERFQVQAIADGHGGTAFFSKHVTARLQFVVRENLRGSNPNIEQVIKDCFATLHKEVDDAACEFLPNWRARGGTTFVMCIIDMLKQEAYFANLGDSPGCIFRKDETGRYRFVFKTNDHTANSTKEQERIKQDVPDAIFKDNYMIIGEQKLMPVGGFGDSRFGLAIKRDPEVYRPFLLQPGDIVGVYSDGFEETIRERNLWPERNEDEIAEDLTAAVANNENIGYGLLQRHIDRNTIKYCDQTNTPKTPENLARVSAMIQSNMDNHMGIFYEVPVPIPSPWLTRSQSI
jgi:serine/threonine protein phosphatase PrpC